MRSSIGKAGAQVARFARWIRSLGNIDVQTKVKHIVGTIAVGFIVVGLVLTMIERNGDKDRARDARTSALLSYQAEVRAYDAQVTQYVGCLSKVDTRVTLRRLFIAQNESTAAQNVALRTILELIDQNVVVDDTLINALLDTVDAAAETIETNRQVIDTDYAEYPPGECPAEPPKPPPLPAVLTPGDVENVPTDDTVPGVGVLPPTTTVPG